MTSPHVSQRRQQVNMAGLCVCQLCTCGRHRCPHRYESNINDSSGSDHLNYGTEYRQAYEPRDFQQPQKSLRPALRSHTSGNPIATDTTYKNTFTPHQVCARAVQPARPYVPSTAKMELESTYKDNYTGQNGKRAESYKPNQEYQRRDAPVSGDTVNSLTYKAHGKEEKKGCRPSPIKHKECIGRNPGKFDARSSMKDDYSAIENPERAQLIRPQQKATLPGGRFHPTTSYKSDYMKKPLPIHTARKVEEYKKPTEAFETSTTVQRDYQPHPGHRPEPCFKPPTNHQPSKAPISGGTTQHDAFREWPVAKRDVPEWSKKKPYTPPSTSFVKMSSYKEEFVQPATQERVRAVRPGKEDLSLSHGPRDQAYIPATHYKEQFVPFTGSERPRSVKMTQKYQPPKEAFTAGTVYKEDFKGQYVAPAKKCNPGARQEENTHLPMQFNTTYHETFRGESPQICPARNLLTTKDGGFGLMSRSLDSGLSAMFESTAVKNGHYYFERRSPSQTRTGLFEAKFMVDTRGIDPNKKPATPRSRSQTPQRPASKASSTTQRPPSRPNSKTKTTGAAAKQTPKSPSAKGPAARKSTKTNSAKKETPPQVENKPKPVPRKPVVKPTEEKLASNPEPSKELMTPDPVVNSSDPQTSTGTVQNGNANNNGASEPPALISLVDTEPEKKAPIESPVNTDTAPIIDAPISDAPAPISDAPITNATPNSDVIPTADSTTPAI